MRVIGKCALLLCAVVTVSGFNLGNQDVVLHLFTRENPSASEALWPTLNSISSSIRFSMSRRSIFTIHTNGGSATSNFNAFVIPAYLQNDDVNLFVVDWSRGSSLYSIGVGNAPQLGDIIASFINILINNFRYSVDQIEIVGHGLGGHIAGIAARNVQGTVPRVIALDPSLLGWAHSPNKLTRDDANTVEVLHTTAGVRGYDLPLGDLDFYPNGGVNMAGCSTVDCSSTYAYVYFAESLTAEVNNGQAFLGTACDSYDDAVSLNCIGERDVVFGGSSDKSGQSGIYSFITNFSPPFARG